MEFAYAYYKHEEPEAALTATDRFLKQYPTSRNVDYVYYLRGMINFNSNLGVFSSIFPSDPSEHDPQNVHDSFDAFKELVTRFPNSKYAPDAKVRMQYLANTLAHHELNVARYYLRRGAYVAAVNRAKTVITDYSQTPQHMDALQILVQCYDALGMKDLRDDAQRVLDLNARKIAQAAAGNTKP
jgi:outer membrane protein assembly factor BamD